MIVEEHKIEVGRGGHLGRPQPSHGDDGEDAAFHPSVRRLEGRAHPAIDGDQRTLRHPGIGRAHLLRPQHAAQELKADAEALLARRAPGGVQHRLVVRRLVKRAREGRIGFGAIRQDGEERRIEQRVEHRRRAREMTCQTRRRAADLGENIEQPGIGLQQREHLHASRQPGEQRVEAGEGDIGIGGPGQRLQQRGHERRQKLARPGAAGRGHAAVMPAADGRRHAVGALEALRRQRLQRFGIVVDAGEDERAFGGGERGRAFEQLGVMALHGAQDRQRARLERRLVREAHEAGDIGALGGILGQAMGLLVGDHLDAVLQRAQIDIGLAQIAFGLHADHVCGCEGAQRIQRPPRPQGRIATAEDELLGLGEELDLADAAPPQLHVVPGDGDRRAALGGMDLALDRVDVLDRREVEIFAPDEGPQLGDEGLARLDIAGRRARLDHRGALPVLAHALVIERGGVGRHGDLGRPGVRPQAQIGAEDIAVAGALLQRLDDVLDHPHQERHRLDALGDLHAPGVEEDDEVDVARIVEFERAVFAHRQHDDAAALGGVCRIGRAEAPGRRLGPQEEGERRRDGRVRQPGQRPGHLVQRHRAGDVAERDRQRRPPLGDAQAREQVFAGSGPGGRLGGGDLGLGDRCGAFRLDPRQNGRLARHRLRQIGAACGGERHEPREACAGRRRALRRQPLQHAPGAVLVGPGRQGVDRFWPVEHGETLAAGRPKQKGLLHDAAGPLP